MTLFLTFPYSKFAHMLYRTLALVHAAAPIVRDGLSLTDSRVVETDCAEIDQTRRTPQGAKMMIKPHGSDKLKPLYVLDDKERAGLLKKAESLPSVVVSSAAAANAVMMRGSGTSPPSTGFMNLADCDQRVPRT